MAACNACSARFAVAVAGKKSFRKIFLRHPIIARSAKTRRFSLKVTPRRRTSSLSQKYGTLIEPQFGLRSRIVKPHTPATLFIVARVFLTVPPRNPTLSWQTTHRRLVVRASDVDDELAAVSAARRSIQSPHPSPTLSRKCFELIDAFGIIETFSRRTRIYSSRMHLLQKCAAHH